MPTVDAELAWGDERLSLSSHPLGRPFDAGAPFGALEPLVADGDDVVLVVPPRARAWVRTINGWRDLLTLRVLGAVSADPSTPGATRVRMRRLRDVEGLVEGVAIVRRPEAWLELEGFCLRVALGDPVGGATRVDRRAIRSLAGFAAFTATLFAGVLSAFGAVPPRQATLDLERLAPSQTPRLPPVRVTPPDQPSRRVETKHEVEENPAGGRVLGDVMAPPRPDPARRAAGPRASRTRGERAAGREGLARLTAAAAAMQTLGVREGPYSPERANRAVPIGREDWLQLATLTGGCGTLAEAVSVAPSLPGPSTVGWGRGLGTYRPPRRTPVESRVLPLSSTRFVPICDRRPCGQSWTCGICAHGVGARERIREIVRQHLAELRFCYESGRARDPSLAGRVTLRWSIAADGTTRDAAVAEDGLGDPIVATCLRAAPEGWTFPTWVGPVTVTYPFVFRAE